MRDYELTVVLDPNLDEAAIEALNTRIQTMVTQRGGTIDSVDVWGRKRLAYPIGRFRDGYYVLSRVQLPNTAAVEIERALKLTENVMRHLLVRADGLPQPGQASQSAPAAQAHAPGPAAAPAPAPTPAPEPVAAPE
ncbi:MAG TPA: 30S ribosomal protein S6 [Chloroflexota bacterium]|nr:30S ribosomal protein S6 [Chloroflexota bacterium]